MIAFSGVQDNAGGRGGMNASAEDFHAIGERLLKAMLHRQSSPLSPRDGPPAAFSNFYWRLAARRLSPHQQASRSIEVEPAHFFRNPLATRREIDQITFDYESLQWRKVVIFSSFSVL
jgi:hypothetical protein